MTGVDRGMESLCLVGYDFGGDVVGGRDVNVIRIEAEKIAG